MTHKLKELEQDASYKDICKAKEDLLEVFMAELHSKGAAQMDTEEAGEVVDMIKDLAEAEKSYMEACYYKKVIEVMEKESEEDEDDRMGYNNRRYANGRYAPKGRGRRMGYARPRMHDPYLESYLYDDDDDFEDMMQEHYGRMGYPSGGGQGRSGSQGGRSQSGNSGSSQGRSNSGNSSSGRSQSGSRMGYMDMDDDDEDRDPRYGKAYNEYKTARRHYSESKSANDKQMMEEKGMRHMNETIGTFREMWKDADPNMRKKMKSDLSTLVNEMNV